MAVRFILCVMNVSPFLQDAYYSSISCSSLYTTFIFIYNYIFKYFPSLMVLFFVGWFIHITYTFIYPKPQDCRQIIKIEAYICQAIFSPNIDLSMRIKLLPAYFRYKFNQLTPYFTKYYTDICTSVWHIFQWCADISIMYPIRIERNYPLLYHYLGIGFIHQVSFLWFYFCIWLVTPNVYPRQLRRSRPFQRRIAESGWAWKLFCTIHIICWFSTIFYNGWTLRISPVNLKDLRSKNKSQLFPTRRFNRAQLFHDLHPNNIMSDLRGWDYSDSIQRARSNVNIPHKVLRECQRNRRRFVADQAAQNKFYTLPRTQAP